MSVPNDAVAHPPVTEVDADEKRPSHSPSNEKDVANFARDAEESSSDDGSNFKQDGVKQVEAITQTWSKTTLWTVFGLLYLIHFVDTLFQAVTAGLEPYITSSFGEHGLLAVTSIASSVVAGASKLAIAKIIDIRGRCEGYILMIILIIIGIIMKAACKNVETYAAGQTFYWVGHVGLGYIIDVIISDTTTLRNRMIMWGLYMSPRLASSFGGPKIAELYYNQINFRWAFGTFIIIIFLLSIPVVAILVHYERKAKKLHIVEEKVKRTPWESTRYYFMEFDVVGMILIIAGFVLILLPLSIATRAPDGWSTGYIIAMFVVGGLCLIAFGVWEKWFTTVPFLDFKYLKNRTILGACLLDGFLYMSVFCWDTYYGSYLQVVHGLSIATSGYTLNAYSVTSTILAPFVGLFIRWQGRYYWIAVAAIPLHVIGTALLYHFRHPGMELGYLVMCQCFIGAAGAVWAMCGPLAMMASVTHQEIAVVLALHGLVGSIGRSIGFSIAGAVWNNDLPKELYKDLPDYAKNQTAAIFGDISLQKADPIGTPIRDAVIEAYGTVQRQLVIAGCAILPFMVICVLVWRNLPVDRKQTKGNVF